MYRLALLGCSALALAGCSSSSKVASGRHPSEMKYGVKSSPRVIPEGEPIPKGGGRDMVGQPYVVAGKTYVPHPGRGYDREGWASWYGTAFHGRLTANGEVFDRDSVAAAHPTLPLPSYVRVTNIVNHRSMIVRVNDRGPYEQGRLIDISERAADALGFHRRGTSRVRVEYVGRASLKGSDDQKLLATLTTDGTPASFGSAPKPTMLARFDLGETAQQVEKPATRFAPYKVASADPDADGGDGQAPERIAGADGDPVAKTASRALPEYDEPGRAPRSHRLPPTPPSRTEPPARLSLAEPVVHAPLDIRPPARPDFRTIY